MLSIKLYSLDSESILLFELETEFLVSEVKDALLSHMIFLRSTDYQGAQD
jgi:hypothetical protein